MSKGKQTYNPCDDCQYSYSKNNQESGMCKICEFKEALALIEQYEKTIDNGVETCNGCHAKYAEMIRTAKAEVAREIFAEIEGEINNLEYRVKTPRKTVKIEELKAQVNWVLHDVVPQTLAKLKKKYTGATDTNDDCKTEGN